MRILYVNHYGWIVGGTPETGLRFTKHREGAKPFDPYSNEYFDVCYYIENTLKCNYDRYWKF